MYYKRIRIMLALLTSFAGYAAAAEDTSPTTASATVVATENGGAYTYVQLDIGGSNVWYAVPATELEPGEQVIAPAGMLMKNFYSKTLDRTFETVYFAEGIKPIGSSSESVQLPAGHPPIENCLPAGHPAIDNQLPAGHPPIGTSTNSACCAKPDEADPCCGSTNNVTQ